MFCRLCWSNNSKVIRTDFRTAPLLKDTQKKVPRSRCQSNWFNEKKPQRKQKKKNPIFKRNLKGFQIRNPFYTCIMKSWNNRKHHQSSIELRPANVWSSEKLLESFGFNQASHWSHILAKADALLRPVLSPRHGQKWSWKIVRLLLFSQKNCRDKARKPIIAMWGRWKLEVMRTIYMGMTPRNPPKPMWQFFEVGNLKVVQFTKK